MGHAGRWTSAIALLAAAPAVRAAPAGPGHGAVFEPWTHRPLAGLTVTIGAASTRTDASGRFVVPIAPAVYDLLVADPDHACVSVYAGLRRRDVWLQHRPCGHAPKLTHGAAIEGTVSGGGPFPITRGNVTIQFSSDRVQGSAFRWPGPRRQSTDPPPDTPAYGPIVLGWDGPGTVTGELLALRRTPEPEQPAPPTPPGAKCPPLPPRPPSTWAFARRELAISTGQTVTADLALQDIPAFAIKLKIAGGLGRAMQTWTCSYRQTWPKVVQLVADGAQHAGRRDPLEYDLSVPDLRRTGASLCVEAAVGWTRSVSCGIAPGETVTLSAPDAPSFTSPAAGAALTSTTRFAWAAAEPGVSALTCEVWSPKPTYPNVTLYTANRSATYPDLSALGVAFPKLSRAFPEGQAAYKCRVGLLQPYATTDDAAGPDGIAAPFPKHHRQSFSNDVELHAPAAH